MTIREYVAHGRGRIGEEMLPVHPTLSVLSEHAEVKFANQLAGFQRSLPF
jgi:hypothetical protein